jgi:hypothetical protein
MSQKSFSPLRSEPGLQPLRWDPGSSEANLEFIIVAVGPSAQEIIAHNQADFEIPRHVGQPGRDLRSNSGSDAIGVQGQVGIVEGRATITVLTDGRSFHTIAVSGWEVVCVGPLRFSHFSEAIMKAILSMALVLGACGLASAVDDKAADPVGTWKCEYEIGGQQRTSTLTIKKEGGKLAGTMSWPDQKEEKLKDLKLAGGTLTFSAVRKLMGNEITVEYTLKIDGDKLKGKGAAEFGGQKQEFDIEGKR